MKTPDTNNFREEGDKFGFVSLEVSVYPSGKGWEAERSSQDGDKKAEEKKEDTGRSQGELWPKDTPPETEPALSCLLPFTALNNAMVLGIHQGIRPPIKSEPCRSSR